MTYLFPIERREAMGLRGRCGVDVWERYLQLTPERQTAYLTRVGVPDTRLPDTHRELLALLADEGIQ